MKVLQLNAYAKMTADAAVGRAVDLVLAAAAETPRYILTTTGYPENLDNAHSKIRMGAASVLCCADNIVVLLPVELYGMLSQILSYRSGICFGIRTTDVNGDAVIVEIG